MHPQEAESKLTGWRFPVAMEMEVDPDHNSNSSLLMFRSWSTCLCGWFLALCCGPVET